MKEIDALADAFILFAAREMREHFKVARWAISVRDSLGTSATNLANENDPDAREAITDATSALAVDATAALILWLSDPKFEAFQTPEEVSAADV
ncbi:hypothetical protein ASD10_13195 [Aeromicrobium sp. Root472D3]|nr:hypothetical protein ASD10_13195 [Aeromicrobium sp. Root472D3]